MKDLYSFLDQTSNQSDFKANLSNRGGFITFSNSGRRGGVKYFQIGLDNLLQTLKDILANLDVFANLTDYVEKSWRDNGSAYFTDPVANANSTVQTKPLFSTLSKIIIWANQPDLDSIDPDNQIILTKDSLSKAIEKLEAIAETFRPKSQKRTDWQNTISNQISDSSYLPYLTALRTKPFMLLAGISGTGKSRIVREMAKACWTPEEDEYGKNCPRNFCMIQVKPNWHDSSDLIGYVSRINGEKYVVGPFLRFIAKAIQDPNRPYFLCLDEMNLAPVEQYFAEYLSVIESRKLQDGHIETDPIVPYENTEAYGSLIDQLFDSDEERKAYKTEEGGKRLTIPENLFVVGTVNMDETTFSFSRKVLDRAMTIEMNEVNLHGGLEAGGAAEFGYIGEDLMGDAAEGKDIYADNQALCDEVISYLGKVNEILEGTPFKIAYRTRNEFLLYAVNRLHFAPESEVWQTLDEMTSMKILSRIEGDNERCERVLRELKNLMTETVGNHAEDNASLKKIDEMLAKLKSGYTSYWA